MRLLALLVALAMLLPAMPAGARALSTQRISGQQIALLAAREIATLTHDPDRRFVAASDVPDQLVTGSGHIQLRAGTPIGGAAFVNVPVEIDLDGHANRTVLVGYRLQRFVSTAVAARDLPAGSVLAADDLTMARVPFTGMPGNGVHALVGRTINGAVLEGQPISLQETAVNQIVKAGATIVFIVRDQGVAVSADAIARTGGGLGDEVFVYNPLTQKALSGTVTGPGTVELDISGADR